MADPFTVLGTVGATIGIIDVTVRLGQSLKKTLAAAPNATRDLADLYSQVETLISINNRIKGMICAPEFSQSLDTLTKENNPLEELWKELWLDTRRISGECQRVLEKIEALIKDIQGLDRDVFITESDPNEQSTTVQSVSGGV
jgi:hypothetical protein